MSEYQTDQEGRAVSDDGQHVWDGSAWRRRNEIGHPALDQVAQQQTLITIGDIACTQTTVTTPNGTYPLAGTTWIVSNQTTTTSHIPAVGIILCIAFLLFCLLGLLFLLMRETVTVGFVQVSVQGPGLYHAVQIPVSSPATVMAIDHQVNYVRALVAALPPQPRLM